MLIVYNYTMGQDVEYVLRFGLPFRILIDSSSLLSATSRFLPSTYLYQKSFVNLFVNKIGMVVQNMFP